MSGPDRVRLLVAASLLEVASGFPYGMVNEMVPLWLRVHGTGLAELGVLTLVGLPWTLRAVWAPAVDRYGTFRSWMVGGLLVCVLLTLGLGGIASAEAGVLLGAPLVVLLLGMAAASATQDTAIDGYLAARIPADDQGRANGVRIASYRTAMAIAGGGGVALAQAIGWASAFVTMAVFQASLILAQLLAPPAPRPPATAPGDWWKTLVEWVARPGGAALVAFLLLFKLGDSAMAPMTRPFLLDAGLTATQVGLLSSTAGAVLVSLGALVGGELVSRIGLTGGIFACGIVQAVSNLGYAGAATLGGVPLAAAASVGESFTTGLGSAATLALVMRATNGEQTATRFALCVAVLGLTRSVAGAFSGLGAEQFGYGPFFAMTFLLAMPGLALIPAVTRAATPPPAPSP